MLLRAPAAPESPGQVKDARNASAVLPPAASATVLPRSSPAVGFAPRAIEAERDGGSLPDGSPEALRRRVTSLPSGEAREAFLREFFRRFSADQIEDALAYAAVFQDRGDSDAALLAISHSVLGYTERQILQLATDSSVASLLARSLVPKDPTRAATVANSFTAGRERAELLGLSASELFSRDPDTALALGKPLTGDDFVGFVREVGAQWTPQNLPRARAWAESLPAGESREWALARVAAAEAQTDPAAARATLAGITASAARLEAAESIATAWAGRDTAAAQAWVSTLPAGSEREAATRGIAEVTPVGIGAVVATDSMGYPSVRELVAGGPAATDGGLQPGDRVTAIRDASGAWIETRDMSVSDFVQRVRGAPGTSVSLQIQRPGDGATRSVTLPRRQIERRTE